MRSDAMLAMQNSMLAFLLCTRVATSAVKRRESGAADCPGPLKLLPRDDAPPLLGVGTEDQMPGPLQGMLQNQVDPSHEAVEGFEAEDYATEKAGQVLLDSQSAMQQASPSS